ncbi:hypothetical protein VST7929_01152 [Vibrio stylophorae]|uniref:Uncharacterized protein n=1 Tax=Vibrio stylophorae TaxID=659351 RepID=A0ABM8ZTM9_9VIBR|nr:hypothetical protein [Vibrio stylophorae]CAH0533288.1 hypothetical protein VST7929_01152 [Vibrio stylophorae]
MEKQHPQLVNMKLLQVSYQLNALLADLTVNATDAQKEHWQSAFHCVLDPLFDGLIEPLWQRHPELEPLAVGGALPVPNQWHQGQAERLEQAIVAYLNDEPTAEPSTGVVFDQCPHVLLLD